MRCRWVLLALLLAPPALSDAARFVQASGVPGSRATLVVAEGEGEPRSLGSYSIRLYGSANPDFPRDDFIDGLVRSRDGAVEAVRFAELDGDAGMEAVVVMRSAGTGGYQSVDVFRLADDTLTWVRHLDGLAPDADPLDGLAGRIPAKERSSAVGAGTGPLQLHHRRQRTKP